MDEKEKLLPNFTTTNVKLPLYQRLAFGTGHVLMVLAVAMWFNYAVLFFQNVLGLSPSSAGTIVLVSQVFGGIFTPFVGIWSDQCVCPKPGRRKIFHLLGTIAVACSFFFIWFKCIYCEDVDEGYKTLYYSSWAAFFQLGSAVQIAQLSLIPELARDKSSKMELNIIRYSFLVVGNLIIFVTFLILLLFLDHSPDPNQINSGNQTMFWVMAIIVIVVGVSVSMCFQLFVKENPGPGALKLKWYKWLVNPEFYLVIGVFICGRVTVILPQTYLPLYLTETLNMNRISLAIGPLILFISSGIFTFLVKRVNKYLKEKMTFFLGIAVVWASVIWIWVMDSTGDSKSIFNINRDNIYIAIALLGIGSCTMLVVGLTLVSYLVGQYTGSSAFVYGWVFFVDRLVNGVMVKIIGEFNPGSAGGLSDNSGQFYRHVLVGILFFSTGTGVAILIIMNLIDLYRQWCRRKEEEVVEEEKGDDLSINTDRIEDLSDISVDSDKDITYGYGARRMSQVIHRQRAQPVWTHDRHKLPEGGMTDLEESMALTM